MTVWIHSQTNIDVCSTNSRTSIDVSALLLIADGVNVMVYPKWEWPEKSEKLFQ